MKWERAACVGNDSALILFLCSNINLKSAKGNMAM